MSRAVTVTPATYRHVFEDSREGQAVLDELTRRFARPAVTSGGIDAVLKTYQNDGARQVLEHIVNMINRANGADPNVDEHNDADA